jgi:uncharacterized DUF497 family protein
MGSSQFEWDSTKNAMNIAKHGIGFEIAAYVFTDPFNVTIPDELHSSIEQRWITIGMVNWKVLVFIHTYPTERRDGPIRIISARFASPAEIRYYEGNEYGRGR